MIVDWLMATLAKAECDDADALELARARIEEYLRAGGRAPEFDRWALLSDDVRRLWVETATALEAERMGVFVTLLEERLQAGMAPVVEKSEADRLGALLDEHDAKKGSKT